MSADEHVAVDQDVTKTTRRKTGRAPAIAMLANMLRGAQMAQTALEHSIPLQTL